MHKKVRNKERCWEEKLWSCPPFLQAFLFNFDEEKRFVTGQLFFNSEKSLDFSLPKMTHFKRKFFSPLMRGCFPIFYYKTIKRKKAQNDRKCLF